MVGFITLEDAKAHLVVEHDLDRLASHRVNVDGRLFRLRQDFRLLAILTRHQKLGALVFRQPAME